MTNTTETNQADSALPAAIRRLVETVRGQHSMPAPQAAQLLEQCDITQPDLAAWTRFDHPAADSFGRAIIHEEATFQLLLHSWNAGDMSAIHQSGRGSWGAMRMFGEGEHAVFTEIDGLLTTHWRRMIQVGSTVPIEPGLIQQMGNPGRQSFTSLHLACQAAPDPHAGPTLNLFDLDEGQVLHSHAAAFFLLPETAISERGRRIKGDFPTWLRHSVELLCRLDRMQPLEGRPGLATRETRLLAEFNSADTWRALRQEMRLRLPRLEASLQEKYIQSLSQELVSATRLFIQLHAAGRFDPRPEVLELIGEIIAMLEHDDFVARIAGTEE